MADKKTVVLLSKDATRCDYFPTYGNTYWETPHIDALAEKGTVFRRHYTSAPSSAMAYTSMFSGLYAHQTDRETYVEVPEFEQCKTLFDEFEEQGRACHIIWDKAWLRTSLPYSKCYGKETTFHNLDIATHIGPHVKFNAGSAAEEVDDHVALKKIEQVLDQIPSENGFVWIHMPHVIAPRLSYGSDIDLFDELAGALRRRYGDDNLFVTADHGHMNLDYGIPVYGFHVYEGAIKIPLIAPRLGDLREIDYPTNHVQLKRLILDRSVESQGYVFSDTAYWKQHKRRFAIIKGSYKYIYSNRDHSEELYDLDWDPEEKVNLLLDGYLDLNRDASYQLDEIYFYPYWDQAESIYSDLKQKKADVWREVSWLQRKVECLKQYMKFVLKNKTLVKLSGRGRSLIRPGRWGSQVNQRCYCP